MFLFSEGFPLQNVLIFVFIFYETAWALNRKNYSERYQFSIIADIGDKEIYQ